MTYSSLEDIRLRKAQIVADLRASQSRMDRQWRRLVHPDRSQRKQSRLGSLLSAAPTVLDAALLGWKLYRRFGGRRKPRK